MRSSGAMVKYGFLQGARSVIVMSCKSISMDLDYDLCSRILNQLYPYRKKTRVNRLIQALSDIALDCIPLGQETYLSGHIPPISVIVEASTTTTFRLLFDLCLV